MLYMKIDSNHDCAEVLSMNEHSVIINTYKCLGKEACAGICEPKLLFETQYRPATKTEEQQFITNLRTINRTPHRSA